jgi:hypothetical protein
VSLDCGQTRFPGVVSSLFPITAVKWHYRKQPGFPYRNGSFALTSRSRSESLAIAALPRYGLYTPPADVLARL